MVNPVHELPISEADARVFVTVAELGSFTSAATLHAMSPSGVSKAITRLETALGVRLLARTTRSLHLTDEGMAFHERAARAFALLAEAADEAAAGTQQVAGTVRVGSPLLFGTHLIAPMLPAVHRKHPRLRVEIVTTQKLSQFIEAGLDLAIAVGDLPDSSFVARPLGYGQMVTVAAPAYLDEQGTPADPAALAGHRCLAFTRPDGREAPWSFVTADGTLAFEPNAAFRADEMHHLLVMAVAGLGLAQLPLFVVAPALASGELVRLLADHDPAPRLASVVYPAGRTMPRRVRAFVDFLLTYDVPVPGVSRRPG